MGMRHEVRNVEFCGDGIVISYLDAPDDLRSTGLMLTRQLHIPLDGGDYDDEVETVMLAVIALLDDALEDFTNLPPEDSVTDEPDDDDDDDDDDDE